MSASEYLSTRTDPGRRASSVRAALYTGVAYIVTATVLIAPYLLLANPFVSLTLTVARALTIIPAFSYCLSVAKDSPFRRRFGEMTGLSLGVAMVSFAVGYLLRALVGVGV